MAILSSCGQILTRPAHQPNTVYPLETGESQVYINLNPATGDSASENNDCIVHQDPHNLITTRPSCLMWLAITARAT